MKYDMKQSGDRIRQLRREGGYTQENLAEKLNVDRSILSRVEAGKYACSVDFLAQISCFFNVSLDYLVFGKIQDRDMVQLKKSLSEIIQHLERFNEQL